MRLLVAGAWMPDAAVRAELDAMGHEVHLLPEECAPLPLPAEAVDGVICNSLFLHHPIAAFRSLRYIQLTSVGCERLPMAQVWQKGIILHTASGVYSTPMAEFAVGAWLFVYKEWDYFREGQAHHRWEKHRGLREMCGKTACIVGCGHVGNACAERLRAFGCRIIGVTAHPRADHRYDAMHSTDALPAALREADAVILSLPLSRETHRLIGEAELASLREGCVLINLSRGGIVDTAALIEALNARRLTAVLDVQDTEPLPPDSPLWDMENVYISPHNSFVGEGNGARLWRMILDNLRAYGRRA